MNDSFKFQRKILITSKLGKQPIFLPKIYSFELFLQICVLDFSDKVLHQGLIEAEIDKGILCLGASNLGTQTK